MGGQRICKLVIWVLKSCAFVLVPRNISEWVAEDFALTCSSISIMITVFLRADSHNLEQDSGLRPEQGTRELLKSC